MTFFVKISLSCFESEFLAMLSDAAIVVEQDGTIFSVHDMNDDGAEETMADLMAQGVELADFRGKLIVPGFVDGHAHAPQYAFTGTGMDLPLLQWLDTHTFPVEARFEDPGFARKVYQKAVRRHLKYGTTTCSYFATVHLEATKVLIDVVRGLGQRAYVGKVAMDRNCPDYLKETTEDGMRDAEEFIKFVSEELDDPLITPVVTPRFVPSCTPELMTHLGEVSKKYGVPVQSHLSESLAEMEWVKQLHPELETYAGVYKHFGLLHERSYFAHCIHCSGEEREMLKDSEAGVVHCPSSNFNLCSGVANVRRYLTEGIKVGLGTDVAGGHSCSMLDAIRMTMVATSVCGMQADEDGVVWQPLSFQEAFHLATVGGAEVLGLADVVGNFVPGKQFDALIVEPSPGTNAEEDGAETTSLEGAFDLFPELGQGWQAAFEKFLYLGDDRNIVQVYVAGNRLL
eukprot:jgi/Undpi1/1265/HiC_scaffold_11.g04657.m1